MNIQYGVNTRVWSSSNLSPGVKEIACAAAIWRPLGASQDGLVQNGLKFLKGLL